MTTEQLKQRWDSGDLKTFKPIIKAIFEKYGYEERFTFDAARDIDENLGAQAFNLFNKEVQEVIAENLFQKSLAAELEAKRKKTEIELKKLKDSLNAKSTAAGIDLNSAKGIIIPEKTNGLLIRPDLIGPQRGDETGAGGGIIGGGEPDFIRKQWAAKEAARKRKIYLQIAGGLIILYLIFK
jgi:hypothetical protein